MRKLTIVLALLIFSSPAWGQKTTIKYFLETYDKGSLKVKQEVHNVFEHQEGGMFWSNIYRKKYKGEKFLYCQPDNLRLTGEQAFQIFRDEVERQGELAKRQIAGTSGMFLLYGLINTFPCK